MRITAASIASHLKEFDALPERLEIVRRFDVGDVILFEEIVRGRCDVAQDESMLPPQERNVRVDLREFLLVEKAEPIDVLATETVTAKVKLRRNGVDAQDPDLLVVFSQTSVHWLSQIGHVE